MTIQQTIEGVLQTVLGEPVTTTGCGRTDSGVHATQFYCFFRTSRPVPDKFLEYLNWHAPDDLAFLEVVSVPENAHVCLDASLRTYDYFIHDEPDVWLSRCSSRFELREFDVQPLYGLLSRLAKQKDFRAFCLTPDRHHSTKVDMKQIRLFSEQSGRLRFQFQANRFLRGMIRVIVYDLMAIAANNSSAARLEECLESGVRTQPVRVSPPNGLFLTGVSYPYWDRQPDLPVSAVCDWKLLAES